MRGNRNQSQRIRTSLNLLLVVLVAAIVANQGVASSESEIFVDPASLAALERDLGLSREQAQKRVAAEHAAVETEQVLREALGNTFAGAWLAPDEEKGVHLMVGVIDADAIARVRAAGAQPVLVKRSLIQLESIQDRLDRASMVEVTPSSLAAWYVDIPNNEIVVEFTASDLEEMRQVVEFVATTNVDLDVIHFAKVDRRPEPFTHYSSNGQKLGGAAITDSSGERYCSIGFPAKKVGQNRFGFTTAGHCIFQVPQDLYYLTAALEPWPLGQLNSAGDVYYPFSDSAFSTYQGDRPWERVITGWGVYDYTGSNFTIKLQGEQEAAIGASICRSGYRTHYRCGTVRFKNVSANYGDGWVYGLTQISACAGGGDSGGASITPAGHAQGMTSGGIPGSNGTNCGQSTPVTYIFPWKFTKQDLSLELEGVSN